MAKFFYALLLLVACLFAVTSGSRITRNDRMNTPEDFRSDSRDAMTQFMDCMSEKSNENDSMAQRFAKCAGLFTKSDGS